MNFDDSYIFFVNQIDIFQSRFGLVFTNKTTLHKEMFFWDFYTHRENDVQFTSFDDSYILYTSKLEVFRVFLCSI